MKFKATKYVEQKLDCLDKFCFELESIMALVIGNTYDKLTD